MQLYFNPTRWNMNKNGIWGAIKKQNFKWLYNKKKRILKRKERSFKLLLTMMNDKTCLAPFTNNQKTHLVTDACPWGISASIYQEDDKCTMAASGSRHQGDVSAGAEVGQPPVRVWPRPGECRCSGHTSWATSSRPGGSTSPCWPSTMTSPS